MSSTYPCVIYLVIPKIRLIVMRFCMEAAVEWDDLRSFLAIAREGTLSAAARRLGVRQSTMGRRLAALEEKAGVRLFERTPRGLRLTAAGEAARAEVERMEHAAQAAERAVSGRDIRLEGTAFAQNDGASAKAQWRQVAGQLRPKAAELAAMMDEMEEDVLAYMGFPKEHRTKIHSTNPIERLNKEVKRRADAVGIFPNEVSIIRLVGAVLLE